MTKMKAEKSKGKKKLDKTTVAIAVALIGCLGTVVAAVVTGLFAYMNDMDEPTDTSSSQAGEIITSTSSTKIGGIITSTPDMDQGEIIGVEPINLCPALWYPDDLFTGTDRNSWIETHGYSSYEVHELMISPYVRLGRWMPLYLTITNTTNATEWVMLANKIAVSIRKLGDAPDVVSILEIQDCGGLGDFRDFTEVPLSSDFDEYSVDAIFTGSDYFTLQPGEFEVFVLNFICETPGVYSMAIDIPYTYQGLNGVVHYSDLRGAICPNSVEYLEGGMGFGTDLGANIVIFDISEYEWAGSEYVEKSP